jgi:hypothetical protein
MWSSVRRIALVVLLCAWTSPALAAWAFVQKADTGTSGFGGSTIGSKALSFGSNTVAGNRAICVVTYRSAFLGNPSPVTMSDSASNTWTKDGQVTIVADGTSYYYAEIWSAQIATQITSAQSITATFNVNVQNGAMAILEYSGMNTAANAVDGTVGTGATTTTSVTTSNTSAAASANELVIAIMGEPNGASGTAWSSAPSGYTARVSAWGQFGPGIVWVGDKNSGSGGTESETGTLPSTPGGNGAGAVVVIYKVVGGGGGGTCRGRSLLGVGC